MFRTTLILMLLSYGASSQCFNDDCYTAQQLEFSGDTACIEQCNGEYHPDWGPGGQVEWFCDEEDSGSTGGCFSQEHDFWFTFTLDTPGDVLLSIESDYEFHTNDYYQGGIQGVIYSGSCDNLTPEYSYNCTPEQSPEIFANQFLDAGTYLFQIDGWSNSAGCVNGCIVAIGNLGLSIHEHLSEEYTGYRLRGGQYPFKLWLIYEGYTLLGQRR